MIESSEKDLQYESRIWWVFDRRPRARKLSFIVDVLEDIIWQNCDGHSFPILKSNPKASIFHLNSFSVRLIWACSDFLRRTVGLNLAAALKRRNGKSKKIGGFSWSFHDIHKIWFQILSLKLRKVVPRYIGKFECFPIDTILHKSKKRGFSQFCQKFRGIIPLETAKQNRRISPNPSKSGTSILSIEIKCSIRKWLLSPECENPNLVWMSDGNQQRKPILEWTGFVSLSDMGWRNIKEDNLDPGH
jgi:hypothetical protein